MPKQPTDEQKRAFGTLLRQLRNELDITAEQLAALASVNAGVTIAQQSISDWEKGKAPRDPRKVVAVDVTLGAEGRLVATLGYDTDVEPKSGPTTVELEARLDELDERFTTIEELLRGVVEGRRSTGQPVAPSGPAEPRGTRG